MSETSASSLVTASCLTDEHDLLEESGGVRTGPIPWAGKKFVFFANTDWYLFNFRLGLARSLRDAGMEVVLVSPRGRYSAKLRDEFNWIELSFDGGSYNPLGNVAIYRQIYKIYRKEKPDCVHNFTIKCVLFGGIAARNLCIPTVNSITGLGHIYTSNSLKVLLARRIVNRLYSFACNHKRALTVFQNDEDRNLLVNNSVIASENALIIRGAGADCTEFHPSSRRTAEPDGKPCRILFASRLLREKGVFELIEAARILRSEGLEFELLLAGERYPTNPSSLSEEDVRELQSDAEFLGHVDDMAALLSNVDLVVLPSYREGTPKILLEAGAAGLPLIATRIAGCRGIVQAGVNGEVVSVKSVDGLVDAMRKLITRPDLRRQYGIASREIVVKHFSDRVINGRMMAVYDRLFSATATIASSKPK